MLALEHVGKPNSFSLAQDLTSILLSRQSCLRPLVLATHNQLEILIIYGPLLPHLDQLPK